MQPTRTERAVTGSSARIHATLGRLFALLTDASAALPHLDAALAPSAKERAAPYVSPNKRFARLLPLMCGAGLLLPTAQQSMRGAALAEALALPSGSLVQ